MDGVVYIPPRAPLPEGAVNFVTARGLSLLESELVTLEAERERLKKGDKHSPDRIRDLTVVRGKITDLQSRLNSARLVDVQDQPQNEVRFGATVTVKTIHGGKIGTKRTFTIVGVDESDLSTMRVAHVAPIARTLLGLKVGESAEQLMGGKKETLEVVDITYSTD